MKKILIIGAGAMGSAFTTPCLDKNNEVFLMGSPFENDLVDKLNSGNYQHPALKASLSNKIKICKSNTITQVFKKKPDLIVIAVSSKGIDWISNEIIKHYSKDISILLLTKGLTLVNNKICTLSDKISSIFEKKGFNNLNISAIKGPCLASGLVKKIRTSAVVANKDVSKAKKISKMISTNYYSLEISNDIAGIETCGAIKNLYSMIIGASEGLCYENSNREFKHKNIEKEIRKKYHHNTAASLIHRSISEMVFFTKFLKGKEKTVYGLAGIGDLYVSAVGGRNSKMGKYLGDGYTYKDAKNKFMSNQTIEAAELAFEIGSKIIKKFNKKDLPLMISLIDTIINNKKFKIKW